MFFFILRGDKIGGFKVSGEVNTPLTPPPTP